MAEDQGGRPEARQDTANAFDGKGENVLQFRDIRGDVHIHRGPTVASPPTSAGKQQAAVLSDSYGTRELADVLGVLLDGRKIPARWTSTALARLRGEVDAAPASEYKIRASRMLDSLVTARKTTVFLRSFMADRLTEQGLARALAHIAGNGALPLSDAAGLVTEADYVEFVALNYPVVERSCGRQVARFVLYLVAEAGLDACNPLLTEWAQDIGALPAFNTEVEARLAWAADHRLRLVVSLHYGLAGDWPESLGAWILLDGQFHGHEDFPSTTADQQGAEQALADAVDWAWEKAEELGLNLRRIEVAVPTPILVHWRPEEVLYAQRLGVDYEVFTRWSQRLDQRPAARRLNRSVRKRLADIAACGPGKRMQWLSIRGLGDLARLSKDFEDGVYSRAIGLAEHPGENTDVLDVVLTFTPILLWPRTEYLGKDHQAMIDAYWGTLPVGFLRAYRDSWGSTDHDGDHADADRRLIADVHFVWDDEDWLNFCRDLAVLPGSERYEPRSS